MTQLKGLVPKGWGSEFIWATNDKYCGKFMNFNTGAKFSMHFHRFKEETWYVQSGKFIVRWIDTESGETKETVIKQGDVLEVPPMRPYQLESLLPNSVIFETGTAEREGDLCRLTPVETVGTQS